MLQTSENQLDARAILKKIANKYDLNLESDNKSIKYKQTNDHYTLRVSDSGFNLTSIIVIITLSVKHVQDALNASSSLNQFHNTLIEKLRFYFETYP